MTVIDTTQGKYFGRGSSKIIQEQYAASISLVQASGCQGADIGKKQIVRISLRVYFYPSPKSISCVYTMDNDI